MTLNSSKVLYAFLALIAALTVGVVLAVVVGVITSLRCLVEFPLTVYGACVNNEKTRRLTEAFGVQSIKELERQQEMTADEEMWDRHIKRMEKKKEKYKDRDSV